MIEPHLTILRELAPYELGEGRPHKPWERKDCKDLMEGGYLELRGEWYRITAQGRAIVEGVS